jgi:hypothetical protein
VPGPAGWRSLLDQLETRAGTDLGDLWRASVVPAAALPELEARDAARRDYHRTLALAGDWALPRAVRDALRAWQFEAAAAVMADARTVLSQRNAVAALAERHGLQVPDAMRGLFEEGRLADASAQAEGERRAILAIDEAGAARATHDDPLSRIGMLGEDPDADLVAARSALAANDLERAVDAANDANRAWTVAWEEGRRRVLLALALLATILVLGSAVVGQLRRPRRDDRRPARSDPPTGPRPDAPASRGDGAAPA